MFVTLVEGPQGCGNMWVLTLSTGVSELGDVRWKDGAFDGRASFELGIRNKCIKNLSFKNWTGAAPAANEYRT